MEELSHYMMSHSPYAKSYNMLHEVELEALKEAQRLNIPATYVFMTIRQDRSADLRRYSAPRVTEVAIIFENGSDGSPPLERDLLIHLRPDPLHPTAPKTKRVSILDNNLDPMTYPILFPFGDEGWGPHIPLNRSSGKRDHVIQMQYYSHRFCIRDTFNPYLKSGKLTAIFSYQHNIRSQPPKFNLL